MLVHGFTGSTLVRIVSFTFGAGFVVLSAHMHAFVSECVQAPELLPACAVGVSQIRPQPVAPGMLNTYGRHFVTADTRISVNWITVVARDQGE